MFLCPCDLTQAGREALERQEYVLDEQLGPSGGIGCYIW
jgi:hypothetical protein